MHVLDENGSLVFFYFIYLNFFLHVIVRQYGVIMYYLSLLVITCFLLLLSHFNVFILSMKLLELYNTRFSIAHRIGPLCWERVKSIPHPEANHNEKPLAISVVPLPRKCYTWWISAPHCYVLATLFCAGKCLWCWTCRKKVQFIPHFEWPVYLPTIRVLTMCLFMLCAA